MKDISKLKKGETYRVVKEFADYDKIIHRVGKTWIFEGTNFVPYHSGLSLFIIENGQNMMYRFQAEPEQQQEILSNFMDYVELIKS